jgi:hypothetical protein
MIWEALAGLAGVMIVLGAVLPAVCMAEVPAPAGEEIEHRGQLLERLADARGVAEEGSDDARLEFAQLLYEAGEFEQVRVVVQPLLGRPGPSIDAIMLGARAAYLLADYKEAEHLFGAALARDPENRRAIVGLVFTYYQTNRYDRCHDLSEEQRQAAQLPHLDLMLAFESEEPYRVDWTTERSTEVAFLTTDPLPIIPVEIEGRGINALIDTGGDTFILDPGIASSLGIEIISSMTGMFAGGMEAEVGLAKASSLRLGGVTLHSVPIAVLPVSGIAIGEHSFDAIVGTGVLKQFLSTLDYPNDRLVLRERSDGASEAFDADVSASVEDEVPFYLHSTHFLLAKGSLNGYDGLVFHVDSGLAGEAAFSAPRPTLEYVGIPIPEVAFDEEAVGGGGRGFEVGSFPIESLGLGRLQQSDLTGSYGAMPPQAYRMLGFIEDGLISHNFLRQYAWTLDFDRMRMIFTR